MRDRLSEMELMRRLHMDNSSLFFCFVFFSFAFSSQQGAVQEAYCMISPVYVTKQFCISTIIIILRRVVQGLVFLGIL